jgi:hypothetical protein
MKIIDPSRFSELKTLGAYEVAVSKLAVPSPDSSGELEKIIDPVKLRELKTLRAYELATAKMAYPVRDAPDSSGGLYKKPEISSKKFYKK